MTIEKRENKSCAHCYTGIGDFQFNVHEPPKTARDFKLAIQQEARRVSNAAVILQSWVRDVNFLNESVLELLDGVAPLPDEKQERSRLLIRELQDIMFKRNNDGWTLTDAADEFQNEFRERFFQDVEQDERRWAPHDEAVIRLLAKSVATNLKHEGAKHSLTAFLQLLTLDGSPEQKAMADKLIRELYYKSEAYDSAGLVGFMEQAEALLALTVTAATIASGGEDEEIADQSNSAEDWPESIDN